MCSSTAEIAALRYRSTAPRSRSENSRCLIDPTLKTPKYCPQGAGRHLPHEDHPASIVRIRLASQVPD